MKLVKEHINFERGLDPKDAMETGHVKERKLKLYYDTIAASGLFDMEPNPFKDDKFSFTSKEILGPDSKLCSNEFHYGEHAEFTLGYDLGDFYLVFDNNGHDMDIESLKDVKSYLGLNESQHFQRGLEPKKAMGIGIQSKMEKGRGFEPLYNDGDWSIEKYFNKNTSKNNLVVVTDGYENINGFSQSHVDYPIMFSYPTAVDQDIAYDNPQLIPQYIKNKVKELYIKIRNDVTPTV